MYERMNIFPPRPASISRMGFISARLDVTAAKKLDLCC
jgi:hypothetical protein